MLPEWLKYEVKKKLERFMPDDFSFVGLRDWLDDLDRRWVIGFACACVFIFMLVLFTSGHDEAAVKSQPAGKAWFYDLNTGELFVDDADKIPPIKAPSGRLPNGEQAGVLAYVLSFVAEPNDSDMFVAYLEKMTEKGKEYELLFRKSKQDVTKETIDAWNSERLIRLPNDAEWHSVNSEQGLALLKEVFQEDPNGQKPEYVTPDRD